jgi:hypothetical protein
MLWVSAVITESCGDVSIHILFTKSFCTFEVAPVKEYADWQARKTASIPIVKLLSYWNTCGTGAYDLSGCSQV